MMTLSTVPVVTDTLNNINVHWSTGLKNHGIVTVQFSSESSDQALIAELITIRHLLFTRQIFGRKPVSGKGYELRVFSGAIKKIAQGRSTKEHIVRYGLFLTGPMFGVQIKVIKQQHTDPLFGSSDTQQIDSIDARDNGNLIPQELWETPMGQLYITRHAIEQYEARLNERNRDPVANPERSFFNAITSNRAYSFRKTTLPESVLKHKLAKYGDDNLEVWRNPETNLHVTILRKENPHGMLVTSYYRDA